MKHKNTEPTSPKRQPAQAIQPEEATNSGDANKSSSTWQDIPQELKSPERARRLQSLHVLAQAADPESLPYLVESSKHDPDPELRALAAQICRQISEQLSHPRDPYGQFRI